MSMHDYRKDACLTMEQFEKVVLHCILYYNNSRVLENFPFTLQMKNHGISAHSSDIWNYSMGQPGANIINAIKEKVVLSLLPRTEGKFTRYGLRANKLRYHCEGYTEQYLTGGTVTVAYNPDNVSFVYLVNDEYKQFSLIERRYDGMDLQSVEKGQARQREHIKSFMEDSLKAKVELAQHIETIAEQSMNSSVADIKGITKRRQKARRDRHRNLLQEVQNND